MEHKKIYNEVDALNEIIVQLKRNNELLEQVVNSNVRAGSDRGDTGKEQKLSDANEPATQGDRGSRPATKKPRERSTAN